MKKRGFTLIELLAVIVILAIIALIATPLVLNTIDEARKGAAKASTTSYIEAIENKVATSLIEGKEYEDKEDYAYDEIEVEVKGTIPTGGIYSLKNGVVVSGTFCVNGYEVSYADNKTEVQGNCTGDELKLNGSVKLSQSSGSYTYPESKTFEVIENISGGTLSCTSSDEEVATCSIDGTTVTVASGEKLGSATLTIKSEGSSRYHESQAAYVVTTKGLLSVTANGYNAAYDGEEHGITVQSSGATIKYGIEEGKYDSDVSPTYTEVGEYTVYYEVTKEGYNTVTGSKDVVITKAIGAVTAPTAKTLTYTGSAQELVNAGSTNTGTIEYKLGSSGTYSTSIPTATNAGTYTLYYKVVGDSNHNDVAEASVSVTITKATGSATLSATSGTVYTGTTTTFTVSGATGTISCTSSNTSVADCSVSENTVTVTGVANGSATITINVAESTNYNATSKTYTATVKTRLSDVVSLGDYVSMTPTSTSYTVSKSLTDYTSDQTINPSELNVWRVIRVNSDGTIDMVSEHVSSTDVYFKGQTGYKNLVGALNEIAKQYENSTYTVDSRHMGYNGQTEYITDTSKITSTTAPWSTSTSDNSNETKGGGDISYTTDTGLVTNALGTLIATNPSGTATNYWLASRYYNYISSSYWIYRGRIVNSSGSISVKYLYDYSSGFNTGSSSGAVRPIVTLKSGLTATGSGTSSSPWVLG